MGFDGYTDDFTAKNLTFGAKPKHKRKGSKKLLPNNLGNVLAVVHVLDILRKVLNLTP